MPEKINMINKITIQGFTTCHFVAQNQTTDKEQIEEKKHVKKKFRQIKTRYLIHHTPVLQEHMSTRSL